MDPTSPRSAFRSPRWRPGLAGGVVVVALALLAAPIGASTPASDSAADSEYDDGWQIGDDGGSGWGSAWDLIQSSGNAMDVDQVIGTSTQNGDGDDDQDGDIDTGGRAWGLRARNLATFNAVRPLEDGLEIGQTLSFEIVTGIAATDEGVRVKFRQTSADTYSLAVTPIGEPTTVVTGELASSGPIDSIRFSIQSDTSSEWQEAFSNRIVVPEARSTAAALVVLATLGGIFVVRRPRPVRQRASP